MLWQRIKAYNHNWKLNRYFARQAEERESRYMSKVDLDGLASLMREHIAFRGNSDTVNLLYAGYLAGLMIEGRFAPDDYHDLNDTLKDVGREELGELFTGYPGQVE